MAQAIPSFAMSKVPGYHCGWIANAWSAARARSRCGGPKVLHKHHLDTVDCRIPDPVALTVDWNWLKYYCVSEECFPSGPWTGFYLYNGDRNRHRMDLALDFGNGLITGEGTDDIGPFVVRGRFDAGTKECHWTKAYVGKHDVFYKGFGEGNGIWGTWEMHAFHGGFKIWPLAHGQTDDDAETEAKTQPVDAVGELVDAGAPAASRAQRTSRGW